MVRNIAFIDGQNLHLGVKEHGCSINHEKFRIYLKDKYQIDEAYYFLGFVNEEHQDLYDNLQRAGFILSFREHSSVMSGKKKDNVDCDIVFAIMRKLLEKEEFEKIVLVSGDGDYKKLVDYLIKREKFLKILFPNKKFASSLYKKLGGEFSDDLENTDIKSKICL